MIYLSAVYQLRMSLGQNPKEKQDQNMQMFTGQPFCRDGDHTCVGDACCFTSGRVSLYLETLKAARPQIINKKLDMPPWPLRGH